MLVPKIDHRLLGRLIDYLVLTSLKCTLVNLQEQLLTASPVELLKVLQLKVTERRQILINIGLDCPIVAHVKVSKAESHRHQGQLNSSRYAFIS